MCSLGSLFRLWLDFLSRKDQNTWVIQKRLAPHLDFAPPLVKTKDGATYLSTYFRGLTLVGRFGTILVKGTRFPHKPKPSIALLPRRPQLPARGTVSDQVGVLAAEGLRNVA